MLTHWCKKKTSNISVCDQNCHFFSVPTNNRPFFPGKNEFGYSYVLSRHTKQRNIGLKVCGICRSTFLFYQARLKSKRRDPSDRQGARQGAAHCLALLQGPHPVRDRPALMLLLCQGLYFTLYESGCLFLMSILYFFPKIIYIILIYAQSTATYVQYSFCYIHIYGHRQGKIPIYEGYENVMRRKMTGRGEEEGRRSTLANNNVY